MAILFIIANNFNAKCLHSRKVSWNALQSFKNKVFKCLPYTVKLKETIYITKHRV